MLRRLYRITLNTKIVQLLAAAFVFLFALPANAQINAGVNEFGSQTALGGGGSGGLIGIISNIINIGLGFLGILAVIYLLYGGFKWMTSGGDVKKVDGAKRVIVNAVIGLAIILSSWAITVFVLGALGGATGGTGNGPGSGGGGGGTPTFDDALGGGMVESHYPSRNAVGIPRNAPIIITFKEPIKSDTFINGADGLQVAGIKIKPATGAQLGTNDVVVTKTADNKSFTIRAKSPLGSASDVTTYSVELNANISKADGTPAFGINPYRWNFDVSTVLDMTPPKVQSVFPSKDATQVPRNAIVTVTFDEPIDPTSGTVGGAFEVKDLDTNVAILGTAKYSNGYRTVEFVPSVVCGTSSCGTTVFCLPSGDGMAPNVEVRAKPATIDLQLGAPTSSLPFDGIADVVGNSLDGNSNGTAEDSPDDMFTYRFATSNKVRTTPPEILSITPSAGAQSVAFDTPITMTFQPSMQYSTLNSTNILLKSSAAPVPYNIQSAAGAMVGGDGTTVSTINHGLFAENASYQPEIGSGVRDSYQNCFSPVSGPGCVTTTANPYCCYDSGSGTVKPQAMACAAP